jgi:hypothetical protein
MRTSMNAMLTNAQLRLKVQQHFRDRVSTGSGSDLVSDQHATFVTILEFHGLTRSLRSLY